MENILVSIRVRPLSKQEAAKGSPWTLTPQSIALSGGVSSSLYNFDRVFDPSSKTVDIYDAHTKKIISSAIEGFNGTIFAYGQTSSGKTYTMRGTSEEPGVIPLAVHDVFEKTKLAQNREFLVRVSYMEIYNEEIKDLLAPDNCKLQIHENLEKGVYVAGLREEIVVSPEQVIALMDFGEAHRHVGETNMNVHSSRSHAILHMVVESRDKSQDQDGPADREILQNSDPVRVSHLHLVDLAGSERVAKTGAEGARLKEGTHINKSLMTLGNVINKLSEGIEKQGGHVPYRDSKLTRILQPALGGNALSVIICNITPSLVHVDETKGTLQFASRANRVKNCAKVNEILTDAALLKRQKKEIAELRRKLQNQESPSDQFEEEILNLRNELLKTELERERMALEFQKAQAERERLIKEKDKKIENLSTMVINSAVDDREFQKHSKKTNRRETWCARPQSGLPLLPDLERPRQKDLPKTAFSELPIQVNRERSFGMPGPFEAIMEEDEEMLTTGTISFDESFYEGLCMSDGLTLPEPGPQSSIADRRRRSSIDWIAGNELEEQLLDLQRRYDTMQCDHVVKINEKDSEIGSLKKELADTQLKLSNASKKDNHKKVQDSERRGKSLDGWKEVESMATIKQLRFQVGELQTEKLYMDRELQRVLDAAREQSELSRQELDEVYDELNLAKKASATLNAQLDNTMQDVQQLQTEKQENEVLFSQLSFALKELETEVENIREPCGGLQSSLNEGLQHLRIHVGSFQECLVDAGDLSALGHTVYENTNAQLISLTSKAGEIRSSPSGLDVTEEHEESSARLTQIDRLTEEKRTLEGRVDVLHMDALQLKKEIARLSLKEKSLEEEVQQLQMEKCENEVLYSQLSFGLKELETEVENIREPCGGLQSSLSEGLQHLRIHAGSCQECLVDARDLSALGHTVYENTNAQLISLTSKAGEIRSSPSGLDVTEEHEESSARLTQIDRLTEEKRTLEGRVDVLHMDALQLKKEIARLSLKEKSLEEEVQQLQMEKCENEVLYSQLSFGLKELETEVDNIREPCGGLESSMTESLQHLRIHVDSFQECLADARDVSGLGHVVHEKSNAKIIPLTSNACKISSSLSGIDVTGEHEDFSAPMPDIERLTEEKRTLEDRVEVLHMDALQMKKEIDRLSLKEKSLEEEVTSLKSSVKELEDDRKFCMNVSEERLADVESLNAELEEIGKVLLSTREDNVNAQEQISGLSSSLSESMKVSEERSASVKRQKAELEEIGKVLLATREDNVNAQEQISGLRSSLSQCMRVSEERLTDVERQKEELEETRKTLLSTREDNAKAQEQISGLSSSLSQKLDEMHRLNKRLQDVEEEKMTLTKTVVELESQLQACRTGLAEALKEVEGWKHRYETESTHYRDEIASLRKELSAKTTLHAALSTERDSLHGNLEKMKLKMEHTESKFKAIVQDKWKLEAEVENLKREISRSSENYSTLEFSVTEAESYSNEKVAQLEGALASLQVEKDAAFAGLERLQNDVDAANEQCNAKSDELESLRHELVTLTSQLQESEGEKTKTKALVAAVTKEKEDIVEELLDAHISFRRQKADLIGQAQENREKCNRLNQDIVLLTEELQKVKESQGEASDANRALQNELQQALEINTEKSLTHHKQVEQLRLELQQSSSKLVQVEQLRLELQQSSSKLVQVEQLRLELQQSSSKLVQVEQLRVELQESVEHLLLELQESTSKLSRASSEEQMLTTENRSLLIANTKLQFALDASRDRLEIFEDRLEESNWELSQFKSLLRKTGFLRSDDWSLANLQQFVKHFNAQSSEARRLETELASKKMEMIDLEIQLESIRAQSEKYEEEIQYLKTRVLTPEQETGVREIVRQNKRLQSQLNKAQAKAQELHELVKEKEASLSALQKTAESIHAQNEKLQRDLAASKVALESAHQLHKIATRAGAIGQSSVSSSKPVMAGKLQPQATSATSTSFPASLFQNSDDPTLTAESTCTESSEPGYRMPLHEKSSNDASSAIVRERKPAARLFPNSNRSRLSSSFLLDLNKENFTLH